MNIIGVHGKKRSGKDTVAKIAGELLGGKSKLVSPADKLKMLLCEALGLEYAGVDEALRLMEDCKDGWTIIAYDGGGNEITVLSGRQLQQFTGDGARRVFGEDFWMDQVLPPTTPYVGEDMQRAERLHNLGPNDTLFIPSVRYENEAERVRDYKGIVIEVTRPGLPDDGDRFISEQPLPDRDIDYTILNDGTLDDLHKYTRAILQDAGLL